jgi:hypothetical protein
MRALAEEMYDAKSRSIMLRLASDYDKLAIRAEERAKTSVPGQVLSANSHAAGGACGG